jgi:hypothetical protein
VHLGGLDSTELSDDDALLLLNRAYWELLDRYKFREKELTATFPLVAGESFYQVPQPFEAIQLLSIEDVNTFQHTTLDRMTQYQYENLLNTDTSAVDKPTRYLRENKGIRIWKTPDQIYTLTIKYWTVLDDLATGALILPAPPQVWHEVILQGGITRGFRRLGDYSRAQAAQTEFERLNNVYELVPAKEAADTHKGGLDVAGYDDVYHNTIVSRDLRWPWGN